MPGAAEKRSEDKGASEDTQAHSRDDASPTLEHW